MAGEVDLRGMEPVPIEHTVLIVNNFIVNTARFMESFSTTCNGKIAAVSSKISRLDTMLQLLEAKLESPSVVQAVGARSDGVAAPQQDSHAGPAVRAEDGGPAPPAPPAATPAEAEAPGGVPPGTVKAREHPRYAVYFRMLRMGVPLRAVVMKMQGTDGSLDVSVLSDPERPMPMDAEVPTGGTPPLSRILFDKYDADRSGSIGAAEFRHLLMDFGRYFGDEEIGFAVREIDRDGSGAIEYDEFVRWWSASERFASISKDDDALDCCRFTAQAFRKYDADGDGSISRDEFAALHSELVSKGLTSRSAERTLADVDSSLDGRIQFNELVSWLLRQ